MQKHSVIALFALTLAAGCAGSFNGELDGEKPSFQQALFGTHEFEEGGHATVAFGFSFAMDCTRFGKLMERRLDIIKDLNETERTDDDIETAVKKMEDAYASAGWPDTGWQANVLVLSEDALETDDKFDVFGEKDALVGVGFAHQTDALDHEEILKEGDDGNVDDYTAIDGKIEFVSVDKNNLKIETGDIDVALSEDVDEDGDDADVEGKGVFSLSAAHCPALSDLIEESFTVSVPVGEQCELADDCPTIGCLCDDGSTLGQPVNARSCIGGSCADEFDACPTSCEQLGFEWTGDTVEPGEEPEEPEEPTGGQEGSCGSFLGANDGCDCGCGTVDSDCAGGQTDACAFNNCVTGSPDPNNNSQCI